MSRYWTFTENLIAGQTARSELVNVKFQEIDTALAVVETEANRTIRLMDGSPLESDYQLFQNPAGRVNKIIGFDAIGVLALLNAAFAWRSDWATAQIYGVNDVVRGPEDHSFSIYICRSSHTSVDFDTEVLAGRWEVVIDLTEARRSLILHSLIVGPDTVQLEAGQDVMVDVSGGPVNLTLPANPVISDQPVNIMHVAGDVGTNVITVMGNGKPIMALNQDMTVDVANASFGLAFCDDVLGWRVRGV